MPESFVAISKTSTLGAKNAKTGWLHLGRMGKIDQGFRSWQFQGFSTIGAPLNHGVVLPVVNNGISERSCDDAVPTTYISILVLNTFCD